MSCTPPSTTRNNFNKAQLFWEEWSTVVKLLMDGNQECAKLLTAGVFDVNMFSSAEEQIFFRQSCQMIKPVWECAWYCILKNNHSSCPTYINYSTVALDEPEQNLLKVFLYRIIPQMCGCNLVFKE